MSGSSFSTTRLRWLRLNSRTCSSIRQSVPSKGLSIQPRHDMNPVAAADGLKLNITEADNALDLELAREVCEYFRLDLRTADEIIDGFRTIVRQWRTLATRLGLPPPREQERMAAAFHLAND